MSGAWWGVDPGTANMGAVLVDDRGPVVVIDITSKAATKGRAATAKKPAEPGRPKRLEIRVWLRIADVLIERGDLALNFRADENDAVDVMGSALRATAYEAYEGDEVAVERVMGNVTPDLADAGGLVAGLLWGRTNGGRPLRPSASAWRRRMLDIPGNTPRAVAERVAVERVREEVPGWPVEASGHAAEAYWIARWGAEVSGGC